MLSSKLNKQAHSGSLGSHTRPAPVGWVQKRHQQCCPPTCFQLIVMKQEISAELTFLHFWREVYVPKTKLQISISGQRFTCTHVKHMPHWSLNTSVTEDELESKCSTYFYFFTLDHPKEVAIEPRTAIEGDDVTLTCRATRYLYTGLEWLDSRNKTITLNVSHLQLNNYSISISLYLHNVSKSSAAGYKCQAYKLHKRVELETPALIVNGEWEEDMTRPFYSDFNTISVTCFFWNIHVWACFVRCHK